MKQLISELSQILNENILPFWSEKMIDHNNGGFIGQIDGGNHRHEDADKSVILNTRILWSMAAVYKQNHDSKYRDLAERAYDYLVTHFLDNDFGGVYWTVDKKGVRKDTKKQVYAQAFMIYALAEYYQASKNKAALHNAIGIYKLIEKFSWDKELMGYLEAFDREWNILEDLRLSDKDANEKKTMNTHLHVLEAYTNLYRVWPDMNLRASLKRLVTLFLDNFIDRDGHFILFFNDQWQPKAPKISYGHDIEGSWLLYEAAEVLDDHELLKRVREASLRMAEVFLKEGVREDGGVYNELEDGKLDGEFHWWPQAEALVGLINAWQLSGKQEYFHEVEKIWNFIKNNLIDWEYGEWFWGIDANGDVLGKEDKAGPWKCPYHNSRALLESIKRLEEQN